MKAEATNLLPMLEKKFIRSNGVILWRTTKAEKLLSFDLYGHSTMRGQFSNAIDRSEYTILLSFFDGMT